MSEELLPCCEAFEKWYIDIYDRDPYIHYPSDWGMNKKYATDAQMEFDIWQAAWNAHANTVEVTERELFDVLNHASGHPERTCKFFANVLMRKFPHGLKIIAENKEKERG